MVSTHTNVVTKNLLHGFFDTCRTKHVVLTNCYYQRETLLQNLEKKTFFENTKANIKQFLNSFILYSTKKF